MDLDETLTIQEVAHLLKIKVDTVRQWVRRGQFPAGFWLTHKEQRWTFRDYLTWLTMQRLKPRPEAPPKRPKKAAQE